MSRDFWRSESGSVSIEAVIVLPVLLSFYMASFVFFDIYRGQNTTTKAAYTLGDILSRQTSAITSDDIEGLHRLFDFLIGAGGSETTWIRVSQVSQSDGRYEIDWSHASRDHQALNVERLSELSLQLPIIAKGENVILVESYARYSPAFNVGLEALDWQSLVVTRPRFASSLTFEEL